MKLIEKIKGLFKEKTKVPNPVEPSINDIDEFITSSINHTNETLKKRASLVYNEIEEILNKIDQDLLILESVNLADRKTIDKLKQITEIGKEELTSSIKGLLISLRKQKENPDIIEITNKLDLFYHSSAKSHFKATQLIGKEIENLTDSIGKIRKLTEDFMKENSELIKSKALLINVNDINAKRKEKERTKEELTNTINEIENTANKYKKEIERINNEIEIIENSQEYKNKINLINEKDKKQEILRETELKVIELIDQRILEKYIRIKNEDKLAREYVESPVNALIKDKELRITEILDDIKELIENKSILVKEPEKTLKKLKIEKKYFIDLKNRIQFLKEEILNINERTDKISASPKSLEIERIRLENNIKENASDLEALNKKHNKLGEEVESLNSQILNQINQSKKL